LPTIIKKRRRIARMPVMTVLIIEHTRPITAKTLFQPPPSTLSDKKTPVMPKSGAVKIKNICATGHPKTNILIMIAIIGIVPHAIDAYALDLVE